MESSATNLPGSDGSAPPSPVSSPIGPSSNTTRPRGRAANVYDAVAGRITLNLALSDSETASGRSKRRLSATAGRYSSRNPKLAPEEALFRRKNAPVRYAEQDIYWASEDLPDGGRRHIPDASLLNSVHAYASRFYEATTARLGSRSVVGTRTVDERSMDETALLAFGILLEEASRECLGRTGDLVFTEAATESKAATTITPVAKASRSVSEITQEDKELPVPQSARRAKRRKVAKETPSLEQTT